MFFKVLLFILHVGVLCMGSLRPGNPEYKDYPELHGWLKIHEHLVDFKTAKANCHSEGALLAGPWTTKFTTTINKLQSTKYPSLSSLYSGAGLKKGSAGIPMEPSENKRCNVFLAGGSMDKVNCRTRLPYVCYASRSTCGNDSYKYNSVTGQCYKLHTEKKKLPDAKLICEEEGGYLAKINSPEELKELLAFELTPVRESLLFIDNDDGGNKYRHLQETTYDDYECDEKHMFICESNFRDIGAEYID